MRKILSLALAALMILTLIPLGLVSASADDYAAQILDAQGGVKNSYNTFKEAVAAVLDGETVKLLKDTTVGTAAGTGAAADARNSVERPALAAIGTITIDGNGKTLSYYHDAEHAVDYMLAFPSAAGEVTVTIKNLTINAAHDIGGGDIGEVNTNGFLLRNAQQKLILENVTLKNDSDEQTFLLNGGSVEVKGCDFSFGAITVDSNGNGGTATIGQNSKLTRITLRSGTVTTISDTEFVLKATPVQVYAATLNLGAGVVMDGSASALEILRLHSPKAVLNVTGGTYKTAGGKIFCANGSTADKTAEGTDCAQITVSGGTFANNLGAMFALPKYAKLTVDGGNFTATGSYNSGAGTHMFGYIVEGVQVTINGGTLTANGGAHFYGIGGANIVFTVNGGYIKHDGSNGSRSFQLSSSIPSTTVITGGVIDLSSEYLVNMNGPAQVTITGGYFIARRYRSKDNLTAADSTPKAMFWTNPASNSAELGGVLNASNFTFVTEGSGKQFSRGTVTASGKAPSVVTVGNAVYYDKYGQVKDNVDPLPENKDGASARIYDGSTGIRFTGTIKKATIDAITEKIDDATEISYGTLLCPTDYLQGLHLCKYTLDAIGCTGYKEVIASANGMETNEDGDVTVRLALVNLQAGNYAREFSAVVFAKYIVDGKTCYTFASYDAQKNSNSMAQVATEALEDVKTESEGAYTYAVEGGYSMYAPADRTVLETYAAALN